MKRKPKISVSWWIALFQAILVRYVKVDDAWIQSIRDAAARGPVVFVLRNRSLIDFLCLRGLCSRHDLPPISFVAGMSDLFFAPVIVRLIRLFRRERREDRLQRLTYALSTGGSAAVFLRRPAAGGALGSQPVAVDGIRLAAEVQSGLDKPLLALPTVFLWGEHAMERFPGAMDFFFGSNEYPRLLRSMWLLIRRRSVHKLIVGTPLDLAALRKERNIDDDALVGVVRAGVGRQIEKIRRSKLGSLTKSSSRIKKEVIASPRLLAELEEITADQGLTKDEIRSRAASIIKKLAADFRPYAISIFAGIMAFIWKRLYTGIEVIDEDMERMRETLAKGPTLILPTHKSHIDYLVISQVMQTHNMMLPHIAAGQNLAFWPMGWLFRSSGAFFIRRKFVNDKFYIAVVNAYLRRLIQEGYAIEVFIEGTRSRTGKLLRPKLGMIEMSLMAYATAPSLDLQILPTFIGYERVIEERSYVKESQGSSKKTESIKGLLKSTRVLLSRYGKLYTCVGKPFAVSEIMKSMNLERDDLSRAGTRRDVALEIALRDFDEINRVSVVAASAVLATVLLTNRDARIERSAVRQLTLWIIDVLANAGANLSEFVATWQKEGKDDSAGNGQDLLNRTIRAFVKGGRIRSDYKGEQPVYTIRDGQRLHLDYYKNNTIHFFVPASLVCTTCLAAGGETTMDRIVSDVALAARIYRWEFMLPIGRRGDMDSATEDATRLVKTAIELLVQNEVLRMTGDRISVVDREKALFISDILRNFHEIYFATISAVRERALEESSIDTRKRTMAIAGEHLSSGRFCKPEGPSRINVQNAIQAYKEIKILRPMSGETPFADGEIGDQIYKYLEDASNLE